MERLQTIWHRYRLLIVVGGVALVMAGSAVAKTVSPQLAPAVPSQPPEQAGGELLVDVEGAVAVPGLRKLPAGSVIDDALTAAGGLTEQADADLVAKQVNRAEQLKDHQKIYIPSQGETGGPGEGGAGGVVNLNTATQAELEALPGIGPSTAKKILDYREQQGSFASIEELQDIPGIGEAKFSQLKDLVTV